MTKKYLKDSYLEQQKQPTEINQWAFDSILLNHNPIEPDKAFGELLSAVLDKLEKATHQAAIEHLQKYKPFLSANNYANLETGKYERCYQVVFKCHSREEAENLLTTLKADK